MFVYFFKNVLSVKKVFTFYKENVEAYENKYPCILKKTVFIKKMFIWLGKDVHVFEKEYSHNSLISVHVSLKILVYFNQRIQKKETKTKNWRKKNTKMKVNKKERNESRWLGRPMWGTRYPLF